MIAAASAADRSGKTPGVVKQHSGRCISERLRGARKKVIPPTDEQSNVGSHLFE
jgi:hypothetical protein